MRVIETKSTDRELAEPIHNGVVMLSQQRILVVS
jgi:hypothetical protein